MEKTNVVAGTKVMEQGDTSGNYMYIVGTGFFDVYVDGQLVNTLGPGSLFGACSLVHVGGTRCVPWSIDRSVQRYARITWGVECISRNFVHLFTSMFD